MNRATIMGLGASLLAASCYYASQPGVTDEGSGDGGPDAQVASTEFPCDVAQALATCWGCHSNPPKGGAPIPLTTRAELMAPSPLGGTRADRAVIRMRDTAKPMPPAGLPRPDAAGVDAFAAWVQAGMPEGSCENVTPPPPGDAGPAPTVCTSGQKFPAQFDDGSPDMNPGLPCRACHLQEEPEQARFFMGTVYPTLHEEDRCYSDVPAGTRVEIIDANGAVALTMNVRPRGNFMSASRTAGIALPFTARVVSPAGTIQMMTPQMSGDCNGCHTEQGANGAPGRILLPSN